MSKIPWFALVCAAAVVIGCEEPSKELALSCEERVGAMIERVEAIVEARAQVVAALKELGASIQEQNLLAGALRSGCPPHDGKPAEDFQELAGHHNLSPTQLCELVRGRGSLTMNSTLYQIGLVRLSQDKACFDKLTASR